MKINYLCQLKFTNDHNYSKTFDEMEFQNDNNVFIVYLYF